MDHERVKNAAIRLILDEEYGNYEDWLLKANLEMLIQRRGKLCKTFAIKCMKRENPKKNNIFSKKED